MSRTILPGPLPTVHQTIRPTSSATRLEQLTADEEKSSQWGVQWKPQLRNPVAAAAAAAAGSEGNQQTRAECPASHSGSSAAASSAATSTKSMSARGLGHGGQGPWTGSAGGLGRTAGHTGGRYSVSHHSQQRLKTRPNGARQTPSEGACSNHPARGDGSPRSVDGRPSVELGSPAGQPTPQPTISGVQPHHRSPAQACASA